MMRLLWVSFLLILSIGSVSGQKEIDHGKLMNATWEAFGELMFRLKYKDGKSSYTPYFPPKLIVLNGRQVSLSGYLIPIRIGREHDRFMLSVLPTEQCAFCGANEIPPMVEVRMKGGKKLAYSDRPIDLMGRVYLNAKMDGGAEIQLLDAVENK